MIVRSATLASLPIVVGAVSPIKTSRGHYTLCRWERSATCTVRLPCCVRPCFRTPMDQDILGNYSLIPKRCFEHYYRGHPGSSPVIHTRDQKIRNKYPLFQALR